MTETTRKLLFWTPRVLTILFILFLALFALDVFQDGHGFWETVLGLFIHLIPNLLLAGVLILSWKREWIGGILFSGLGIFYLVMAWGKVHWMAFLFISGPLFLVGILFLVGWSFRNQIRV